jgi:ubiquinol-cytochrome c reductase cytochrome b subunit
MKAIFNWFDNRTGYRSFVHDALYERIPGGSRWRYVWGSTLIFTFSVQMITGLFLWMAYSPSSQTAWESVFYIQHEMQYGWLLRGIHHFTAQAMIVLLALHLMQVIIDGAYKAPREVNFWLGLILFKITLGLSLTGYLLPWDQKGYWATKVATKLSTVVPFVGPTIERLVIGGPNYGHHTLTRFFAMHAGVLPALLIGFLVLHLYVFRRHGITVHDATRKPETTFWPDQVLKDAVACLSVLLVVLLLVFQHLPKHDPVQLAEEARLGEVLGADLGAPADPSDSYSAARPEWYFLFLFQFLKYFPGETEIWGAIYIPGGLFMVMFLMPFIGRWKLGHRFNVAYMFILLIGAGVLTGLAVNDDRNGLKSADYKRAVADAQSKAERVTELIKGGQFEGYQPARVLLQTDPKTRGPALFVRNCSQCHRFNDHDGSGKELENPATASDLGQFGTRVWIRGFIENPAGPKHFGPTANASFKGDEIGGRFTTEGEMAAWASENVPNMEKQEIDGVVEFLLSQSRRVDVMPPDPALVELGRKFFFDGSKKVDTACNTCHRMKAKGFDDNGSEGYPMLTGYASEVWLRSFLLNPGAEEHYGENNAMPSYKDRMSEKDLDILIRWMRHRWYEPEPN